MISNFSLKELQFCRDLSFNNTKYDITGESGAMNLYLKTGLGSWYLVQLKDFEHLQKLWYYLTDEEIKLT